MDNNLLFDFTVAKAAKTVNITREFNAGLPLVWDAFSKKELLDQWWAPKPYTSKTKVMEFKVGGRRFYAMVGPDGKEGWGVQKYTLINPKTHLTWLSSFADKDENINAALPTSEWALKFGEQNGTTTLQIAIKHKTLDNMETVLKMGFKEGFTMTLNDLETLLEQKKQ